VRGVWWTTVGARPLVISQNASCRDSLNARRKGRTPKARVSSRVRKGFRLSAFLGTEGKVTGKAERRNKKGAKTWTSPRRKGSIVCARQKGLYEIRTVRKRRIPKGKLPNMLREPAPHNLSYGTQKKSKEGGSLFTKASDPEVDAKKEKQAPRRGKERASRHSNQSNATKQTIARREVAREKTKAPLLKPTNRTKKGRKKTQKNFRETVRGEAGGKNPAGLVSHFLI